MIYLFHGGNSFLSYREARLLLSKLKEKRKKQKKSFDEIILDASSQLFTNVTGEVETPSLFSNLKIIFLKRPLQNPQKDEIQDWLIGLLKNSNKLKNVDLVIWEDQKIRANSKIVKDFTDEKRIYESPELKPRTFVAWAKQQTKDFKFKIDTATLELLSQRVNYEPERFFNELEKIRLLRKRKVTVEDVEIISPDTLEHSIWELIDLINSKRNELASQRLNSLIQQGNDPHYILSMIERNLRIILLTKVLIKKGKTTTQIAKETGNHPFVISKTKSIAQKMRMSRIKKLYEKITNIDYSTKTGQIEIELALNLLISVI